MNEAGEKMIKETIERANNGGGKIIGHEKMAAKRCATEIAAVLDRYDCQMIPEIVLTPGNVMGSVKVGSKPSGGSVK